MADYLKKFATQADYDAYIQAGYPKPNVSYIEDTDVTIFTNYQDGAAGPDAVVVGISPEDWPSSETNFSLFKSVREAYVPEGVTTLQKYGSSYTQGAFAEASRLESVVLPSTLTDLGTGAFYNCAALTSVNLGDTAVTQVGTYTFYGCTSLTSIDIPPTVTVLSGTGYVMGAFQNCTSLTSVNFMGESKLTTIGSKTFNGCRSLTSIDIPPTVTNIGQEAFTSCAALTSIDIPPTVTEIGSGTFYYCNSLSSVTVRATTPPTVQGFLFSNTPSSLVIYVPAEAVEAYKAASGWSNYASMIQAIPE